MTEAEAKIVAAVKRRLTETPRERVIREIESIFSAAVYHEAVAPGVFRMCLATSEKRDEQA